MNLQPKQIDPLVLSGRDVTAVLGPTNTGKTHYAIERMCGHSSGMMGFPLRLLAREVYDRVVAIKGAQQVALITGEEKIVPPGARYFLCTAESMPISGGREAAAMTGGLSDFAFVALDEAQLGADPERGHIFTDRILRARGREETMILGSASIAKTVKALIQCQMRVLSRWRLTSVPSAPSAGRSTASPAATSATAALEIGGVLRIAAALVMGIGRRRAERPAAPGEG